MEKENARTTFSLVRAFDGLESRGSVLSHQECGKLKGIVALSVLSTLAEAGLAEHLLIADTLHLSGKSLLYANALLSVEPLLSLLAALLILTILALPAFFLWALALLSALLAVALLAVALLALAKSALALLLSAKPLLLAALAATRRRRAETLPALTLTHALLLTALPLTESLALAETLPLSALAFAHPLLAALTLAESALAESALAHLHAAHSLSHSASAASHAAFGHAAHALASHPAAASAESASAATFSAFALSMRRFGGKPQCGHAEAGEDERSDPGFELRHGRTPQGREWDGRRPRVDGNRRGELRRCISIVDRQAEAQMNPEECWHVDFGIFFECFLALPEKQRFIHRTAAIRDIDSNRTRRLRHALSATRCYLHRR